MTQTPAQELRAASTLLRERATQVRRLMTTIPGPPYPTAAAFLEALSRRFPVATALGDHIASWTPEAAEAVAAQLELAARIAEHHPIDPAYAGMPEWRYCTTCQDEEPECVQTVTAALAIARATAKDPA